MDNWLGFGALLLIFAAAMASAGIANYLNGRDER